MHIISFQTFLSIFMVPKSKFLELKSVTMSHFTFYNLPINLLRPNLILIIRNSDSHRQKMLLSLQKINIKHNASLKKEKT